MRRTKPWLVVAAAQEPRADRHVGLAPRDHRQQCWQVGRLVLAIAVELGDAVVALAHGELSQRLRRPRRRPG